MRIFGRDSRNAMVLGRQVGNAKLSAALVKCVDFL